MIIVPDFNFYNFMNNLLFDNSVVNKGIQHAWNSISLPVHRPPSNSQFLRKNVLNLFGVTLCVFKRLWQPHDFHNDRIVFLMQIKQVFDCDLVKVGDGKFIDHYLQLNLFFEFVRFVDHFIRDFKFGNFFTKDSKAFVAVKLHLFSSDSLLLNCCSSP